MFVWDVCRIEAARLTREARHCWGGIAGAALLGDH
jgi:hypothetical protein